MADMLSNTVGIMLFILAFTVLQTGGVLIPQRLPMEREANNRRPIYYVCWNQRLLPLNSDLIKELGEGLEKPTYHTAEAWVAKFNRARAEDDFFAVVPKGEAQFNRGAFRSDVKFKLSATFKPKGNVGDTFEELDQKDSLFEKHLRELDKQKNFIYFLVYPDNIELFRKAREYAKSLYGLGVGWGPVDTGKQISFNLTGEGGIPSVDQ